MGKVSGSCRTSIGLVYYVSPDLSPIAKKIIMSTPSFVNPVVMGEANHVSRATRTHSILNDTQDDPLTLGPLPAIRACIDIVLDPNLPRSSRRYWRYGAQSLFNAIVRSSTMRDPMCICTLTPDDGGGDDDDDDGGAGGASEIGRAHV